MGDNDASEALPLGDGGGAVERVDGERGGFAVVGARVQDDVAGEVFDGLAFGDWQAGEGAPDVCPLTLCDAFGDFPFLAVFELGRHPSEASPGARETPEVAAGLRCHPGRLER